jgi:hypothetical protein
VCIDDFLEPEFAEAVAASFPSFSSARRIGKEFHWVNEDRKVQITDSRLFPEAIARLNGILASDDFLAIVSNITGIQSPIADPTLAGGGMHIMARNGLLDAHLDFNLLDDRQLYRRLNILVYLTPGWREEWGGHFELWDPAVKHCEHRIAPRFNRCLLFNTHDQSFHGVSKVRCPDHLSRNSLAGYYYTKVPPSGWTGSHGTIYRPRPGEWFKGAVSMPLERLVRGPSIQRGIRGVRKLVAGGRSAARWVLPKARR